MRVALAAPAKVNLWLRIGPREPSGFHDLDTLFCALELADTVTVRKGTPGDGLRLRTDFADPLTAVPELGPDTDNLAVRAATAFAAAAGVDPDLEIDLVKRIPAGGGLGGGSADAGAVLRALDRIYPGAVSGDRLLDIAAGLGSDVPFCASRSPLALGRGRGTRITAVAALPPRDALVVLPPFGISTAHAYGWLDADRREGRVPTTVLRDEPVAVGSWEDVQAAAANDFEPAVFRRHPELEQARDILALHGARPALLAGSGSTLFGVFDNRAHADAAAAALGAEAPGMRSLLTRTGPAA